MFKELESKNFSTAILFHRDEVSEQFGAILEDSLEKSKGEVDFLTRLTDRFEGGAAIVLPVHTGLIVHTWAKMIHQRPYVSINGENGPELGDLLVSVRYELSGGVVEEKAIIYQVKLEGSQNSNSWKIAHNQLNLLTNWPQFTLSLNSKTYHIKPLSKEASSYFLLRKPTPLAPKPVSSRPRPTIDHVFGQVPSNYGHVVPAIDMAGIVDNVQDGGVLAFDTGRTDAGSSTATADSIVGHTKNDWSGFADHFAFLLGENLNSDPSFKELVEDTFSFVGSQPKTTDFSHGYFCCVRITVKRMRT